MKVFASRVLDFLRVTPIRRDKNINLLKLFLFEVYSFPLKELDAFCRFSAVLYKED